MFDLNLICYNQTFSILDADTQSLKDCFINSFLLAPIYLIFAILNGYILGSSTDLSRHFKHISIRVIRYLSTILLAIILVDVFAKYFISLPGNELNTDQASSSTFSFIISDLYKLASFSIHVVVVLNKNIFSYYPKKLLALFLALTLFNAVNLINYFYQRFSIQNHKFNDLNQFEKYNVVSLSLYNLFLCFYLLVVFLNYTKTCRVGNKLPKREVNQAENTENLRFESLNVNNNDNELDNSRPSVSVKSESNSEEDKANYLSYMTFSWLQPVMDKGFKRQLKLVEQLPKLPIDLNITNICERFISKYTENKAQTNTEQSTNPIISPSLLTDFEFMEKNSRKYEDQPSSAQHISKNNLISSLLRCFGRKFFLLGVFKLANDLLNFSGPLLLNQLVQFVENKDALLKDGMVYAGALFICTLVSSIINIHFTNSLNKLCLRIRTALISLVYRKAVLVKLNELNGFSIGQIVNYMSIDSNSIVNAFPSFHSLWSLPIQISITLYLLYSQIGISFLVGVGFVLILIPINKFISDFIGKVQTRMMLYKDKRVKLMTEFLQGIRIIKFYSWERYFLRRIGEIREKELQQLKAKKYLDAGCVYFWASTPILMSVFTFITYVLLGNKLTPSKVFTSLALFNMLINPLNAFPWVINGLVGAWVSLKRLQTFLNLENLNWLSYYTFTDQHSTSQQNQNGFSIQIRDANFSWKNENKPDELSKPDEQNDLLLSNDLIIDHTVLRKISLKIKKGQLVGVIGKVGCGKTSFLHTIMAEIEKLNGDIRIDPSLCSNGFAYVGQECWIKATSIKENILFGLDFNPELYKKVIDSCALGPDLSILPNGDETLVGENGVCLSGGQKARLSLARACYSIINKELFLFDDPLSAVDAHVAKHIYNSCINELLANKTRILCTHHFKHLVNADLVLVIDNGRIIQSGKGKDVIPSYMKEFNLTHETQSLKSYVSLEQENGRSSISEAQISVEVDKEIIKQDEEEKEHGVIDLKIYKYYSYSVGVFLTILTILSLFLMQASRNSTDFWLSYWTQHHSGLNLSSYKKTFILNPNTVHFYSPTAFINDKNEQDSKFFFIVYGSLCGLNSFFTLMRAFSFAISGILAGKYIHKCLIDNLSRASLRFFDTTPRGRILNRLSTDIYAIDDSLPFILNIFLANLFGLAGILVVTCYSLPWFSLSLIPLSIIYYSIQNYYRWTSREVKRLSSISLSPIYTHFHETISGLITIRAFRKISEFLTQNEAYLNSYIRAEYISLATSQWLNFRLQMISVLMITVVGFTAVFQHIYSTANASLIGLALSYILSVTGLLNGLITSFTETEKEMVSVERCYQFKDLESEDWDGTQTIDSAWPSTPKIEFSNVCLRYKEGANLALNNVSFSVKPGEKIGICGRTGSGKSSLLMALFRGAELESGVVKIGDLNTRTLSLSDLREKLSIIPQDPFLFDGTLRENIDPTRTKGDDELWRALAKVRLEEKFKNNESSGLDTMIEERGRNLSCGEKQLVCLARAIISERRILCIDEATASVDFETDNFIQHTIKREFRDVTVLTIAHRINTIFDYDRIIVMDGGRVAEFNTVENLLADRTSIFYSLVNEKEQKQK